MVPSSLSAASRGLLRLTVWVLLGGLLLLGCEGEGTPPDVPAGEFTVYVDGTLSDTLSGPAYYRLEGGALTSLELGPKDGPGLSVELEPRPPDLRIYEVIEPELFRMDRADSPPGVLAFLSFENAQFEATDGTLELTYVGDDQVGATFRFLMEGTFGERGGDEASVEVTGVLNAPSRE